MKKILFIIALIISFNTYAKSHVSSHRAPVRHISSSRSSVSSTRSYSKPKIVSIKPSNKTTTHKSYMKPMTNHSTNNSYKTMNVNENVKSKSNNTSSSYSSSFSNNFSDSYRSNGLGIMDYLLLNSMFKSNDNNTVHKRNIKVIDENDTEEIKELIAILEREIEEERNRFEPNKEKIQKYEKAIEKLKSKIKE